MFVLRLIKARLSCTVIIIIVIALSVNKYASNKNNYAMFHSNNKGNISFFIHSFIQIGQLADLNEYLPFIPMGN